MGVFRKFPRTFWVANTIELFERWAWYGFFMLFANYLTGSSDMGGLEFTQSQKGILMGVGTGILYFLPVLTGAIADRYGYKKVLALAFVIYTSAFILLPMFSTFTGVFLMYLYLAVGAALFKPIISATIAKTTTDETASIGFGIYYMMVNIGAFFGPMVTLLFKGSSNLVFYVSAGIIALNFVLLLFYKELPPGSRTADFSHSHLRGYIPEYVQYRERLEIRGIPAHRGRILDHVQPTLLHPTRLYLAMDRHERVVPFF